MADTNYQRLAKMKTAVSKLTKPISDTDKKQLLKMIADLSVAVKKAVAQAPKWRKDRDIMNGMKKKGASQKAIEAWSNTNQKYARPLIALTQKISADADKAASLSKRLGEDMKKQKQDKLSKALQDITGDFWAIREDYGTFLIWVSDA